MTSNTSTHTMRSCLTDSKAAITNWMQNYPEHRNEREISRVVIHSWKMIEGVCKVIWTH